MATSSGTGFAERLVNRVAIRANRPRPGRRGFLGGAALLGAALAVDPWSYLTRPASAYDAVCGADNTCAAGYTVFCCTINAGNNSCPPDSFIGGWWKADNSNFCGGSARYYIDCNAYRDGRYSCHCNTTTCDQRRVACNQFRYGQCNTQIPYSNTGPVLCRVVSCTPPWVQYGSTCSSSSATDNNTATHSAPCISGHPPVGSLESVTATGNLVHLKGWAYDPDQTATSIRVLVYQDDKALTVVTANVARPDVDAALHISGSHGFSLSLAASNGSHNYKCYAINAGGGSGNPLIGVHNVTVNPGSPPTGSLESATATGNQVLLSGWAYDRDAPGSPVRLVIYADDKPYTVISTTVDRPDVNAALGLTGTHGYRVQFTATPGRHNYKVYAHNLGAGSGAPLIGVHNVVVGSGAGQLQAATASSTGVRLVGRAADPDSADSGAEFSIAVYEDSHAVHWAQTSRQAFDLTVPAGPGVHSYTVHAVGADGASFVLGSRTVAVDQQGALGRVERLEVLGNSVRISGWAFDAARPSVAVEVTVFRDGALLSRHSSGRPRPDVNRDYGAAGDHGFELVLAAEPGTHTYTVYAAGRPGAASMVGGRTVTGNDAPADEAVMRA